MAGKGKGLQGGKNKPSRSKVTGRKFQRQDPTRRRHGPKGKRLVFREAIEWALTHHFKRGEWLTSSEIAHAANQQVPKMWSQLNGYSVGAVMRSYEAYGCVQTMMKNNVKYWKLIKPMSEIL